MSVRAQSEAAAEIKGKKTQQGVTVGQTYVDRLKEAEEAE